MMKKNKKIRKIFTYLMIVLIIVLIAILMAINTIKEKEEQKRHRVMGVDFSGTIHSLKVSNLSTLESFVGAENNKGVKVAKKFRDFFTVEVPEIKKNLQNFQDYSEYYQIIHDKLKIHYFDIDEESFINLCKKISSMESNLETEYDNCNFSLSEDKNMIVVTCSYQNGEKLVIQMNYNEEISVK